MGDAERAALLETRLVETHAALNDLTGFVFGGEGPHDYHCYQRAKRCLTENREALGGTPWGDLDLPLSGNLMGRP